MKFAVLVFFGALGNVDSSLFMPIRPRCIDRELGKE